MASSFSLVVRIMVVYVSNRVDMDSFDSMGCPVWILSLVRVFRVLILNLSFSTMSFLLS